MNRSRLGSRFESAFTRLVGAAGAVARSELYGGPRRNISPKKLIYAVLSHDGELDRGRFEGETRVVTGLTVTNFDVKAVTVEVESEADHSHKVTATVQPGQTVFVQVDSITQYWNLTGPIGFTGRWDGVNIRWSL